MKVFFSASQRGKEFFEKQYKVIDTYLEDLSYKNINKELFDESHLIFLEKLHKNGPEAYVKMSEKLLEKIRQADITIFECSLHSLSIGFLIHQALQIGKPVIILYQENYTPTFLAGLQDEKIILRQYNEKNLKKVLNESLKLARERRDKRFNFFLSPKLLDYLEQASKKEGITKSKLIRDLIVNHMRSELKTDSLE